MANVFTLINNIITRCANYNKHIKNNPKKKDTFPFIIDNNYSSKIDYFNKIIYIEKVKNKYNHDLKRIKQKQLSSTQQKKEVNKIKRIYHQKTSKPKKSDISSANKQGTPFEEYIKDLIADSLMYKENQYSSWLKRIDKTFLYTGNNTNPPDAVLRGKNGDAIEFKKRSKNSGTIQLNSSYFHHKLLKNDHTTQECRKLINEKSSWNKDLLYIIGRITSGKLHSLIMIYGKDYASLNKNYINVEKNIIQTIVPNQWNNTLKDLIKLVRASLPNKNAFLKFKSQFKKSDLSYIDPNTKELGRINNVDKVDTYLRIRGMWVLQNPNNVIKDLIVRPKKKTKQINLFTRSRSTILNQILANGNKNFFNINKKGFSLALVIDKDKVKQINKSDRSKEFQHLRKEEIINNNLNIIPIKLESPNRIKSQDPKHVKYPRDAYLITYTFK